jgi:endonuclease YncB( thermonuclease family)
MGFTGKVIKVVDGNTIDVLTDDQETIRIRFSGIDTPERGQPFGNNVPRRLKELVAGEIFVSFRKVMIDTIEQTDRPTDRHCGNQPFTGYGQQAVVYQFGTGTQLVQ